MDSFAFRFFVFVCFGTMLSLPAFLLESVQAQEKKVNIFERRNTNVPKRDAPRTVDNEQINRVSRSLQKAFDSDPQRTSQTFLYFGTFLGGLAILSAGLVYWQMWRQKRMERELNDPMFLVYELSSAHQLSEQEKRVMQALSEKNSLPTPLKLFVEPRYLLDAWESDTFASSHREIRLLLSKLFDIIKEGGENSTVLIGASAVTELLAPETKA